MKPASTRTARQFVYGLCALGLTGLGHAQLRDTGIPGGPEVPSSGNRAPYASPAALAGSKDGRSLYVACATANCVALVDTRTDTVNGYIPVPESPSGLALSSDDATLYVTCSAPRSCLCIIDTAERRITGRIALGHTALAPVLSPDGTTLYVCNRFNDEVSAIDLFARRERKRVGVEREPIAAAISPDGKRLLVVNHLHGGSADTVDAAAAITVIETATLAVTRTIRLPLGSSLARGIALSPDGRFAAVAHLRSLFWLTTSSVELGRINGNALTVLDLQRVEALGTVLLDQTTRGAANPWAVAWSGDGKTIVVSHAGTHELSLVDAPIAAEPRSFPSLELSAYARVTDIERRCPAQPVRVRARVSVDGEGPRALAVIGSRVYAANYYSDTLARVDLADEDPAARVISLWPSNPPDQIRRGEMLFNDGRLCAQGWQSCASCHDTDGRADALNWDLLNDGVGNPKNTKSLVWAHQTAPAMALGVRSNAQGAVRAGIRHILFSEQPDEVAEAIDAFLQSQENALSPHRVGGRLSPSAQRGERLFFSARTGCCGCHPPPLFTDLASHNIGTAGEYKAIWGIRSPAREPGQFDTPTLVELWRTAPYLHDGSAATLRELFATRNAGDRHGQTSQLNPAELDDLVAYLLSL